MKAINKFQAGNQIQIPKLVYKGVKEVTIVRIENNQIKFRYTTGKTEAEGITDKDAAVGVTLTEKHLEAFQFKKTNTNPIEYIHTNHPGFNIQVTDQVIVYKDIPLLYVHELQNLYFAVTGSDLT
jgi:hypothetical protein